MEQEIKDCWRCIRFNSSTDNTDANRRTALQRLIEFYKRFSRIALIMALCSPLYFFLLLRDNSSASMWQIVSVVGLMVVYFFTVSAMDGWLARGVASINLAEMPVAEVCRRAFFYRKRHFQFMAVLIPMCLIIMGLLAWLLSDDLYFLCGMASGAVIGAIVGFTVLNKFMKEYKALTADDWQDS